MEQLMEADGFENQHSFVLSGEFTDLFHDNPRFRAFRIPNGTPIENYRFYVETACEILGLPKAASTADWRQMAF